MRSPPNPDPMILTVHDVPRPELMPQDRRTRIGRVKMLLILLACAAPVLASYFTYYVIRPQGHGNYGQLIDLQPLIPPTEKLLLRDLDGQRVAPSALKGQWLLVVVAGADCPAGCEQALWLQRQLRESLGRDKERVERVWLVLGDAPVRREILPAMQGARVLRAAEAQVAEWLHPESGRRLGDHFYLVDPLGRWMMRFPPEPDAKRVRRDLDRLLRASSFWDNDGLQPAQEGPR